MATPIAEDEEMTGRGILPEHDLHEMREAVERTVGSAEADPTGAI
jgi:hypothetical protein